MIDRKFLKFNKYLMSFGIKILVWDFFKDYEGFRKDECGNYRGRF